jgi:hypothetical protein
MMEACEQYGDGHGRYFEQSANEIECRGLVRLKTGPMVGDDGMQCVVTLAAKYRESFRRRAKVGRGSK